MIENCGVMLEPQEGMSPNEVLRIAAYAEGLGFGYLFRSDHLLSTSGKSGVDSPECWTTLGALASATDRIRFGPLVSPIGFRNPALLAKMACTVHSLSGGRFRLAVGAGWYQKEYDAVGLPFPPIKVRIAQLHEALQIIRPLTHGERVDFRGKYFSAHLEPSPKPSGRVHLIIGGKSPAVIRAAMDFADEWNVYSPARDAFFKLIAHFDPHRRPTISTMGPFVIAETRSALDSKLGDSLKRRALSIGVEAYANSLKERGIIVGTVDEFRAQVGERTDWGVQRMYFQLLDPGDLESVALLGIALKGG